MPPSSRPATHEWTFFDHLVFLLRNAPWLLGGMILCGGGGLLLSSHFFTSNQATGLLTIGSAYFVGSLEPGPEVASRISSSAFRGELCAADSKLCINGSPTFSLAATSMDNSSLVRISAAATDPEIAEAAVTAAAARIVADHTKRRDRVIALMGDRVREVDSQTSTLEAAIVAARGKKNARGEIIDLGTSDPTARVFAQARHSELLAEVTGLRSARLELRLRSDPGVMPATRLMDGPSRSRVSQSKRAGAVGGLGGFALVCFALYFREERRRRSTSAAPTGD